MMDTITVVLHKGDGTITITVSKKVYDLLFKAEYVSQAGKVVIA
jgi:hypothetical protein